jgi:hypothetical protein
MRRAGAGAGESAGAVLFSVGDASTVVLKSRK